MKDTAIYPKLTFNFKGILRSYDLPLVMGIINTTPDSFFGESRVKSIDNGLALAEKMISDGADILDIGGYSSRPGAADISIQEELDRVIPLVEKIHHTQPNCIISIDTFRSQVAESALRNGASIVNDISGGQLDPPILKVTASYQAPYILMHMVGTPQNMTTQNMYKNLINDIRLYFTRQISAAQNAGIRDIILDPGFGFSKNIDQNFELMTQLHQLTLGPFPVLAGVSRKSMIYKTLDVSPEESLNGTAVMNTIALLKGASILRVHDVKEAKEAVKLVAKLRSSQ